MRKKWNGYDFWRHCLLNRAHNIFSTVFFVSNTTVSLFSLCWSIFALIRQNVTSLFATSGIIWSKTIIKTNIAYYCTVHTNWITALSIWFVALGSLYFKWIGANRFSYQLTRSFFSCTFKFVWVFRVRISLESF